MVHYALRRADIGDDVRAGLVKLLGSDATRNVTSGASGSLLEVAVALPVQGTFTYRDPASGSGRRRSARRWWCRSARAR